MKLSKVICTGLCVYRMSHVHIKQDIQCYISPTNTGLWQIWYFICKMDNCTLMCAADKIWMTELTLIHKNIRSVCNSHAQVYRSIWRKTHYDVTDKKNNVSSEGLDRHYHKYPSSSYRAYLQVIFTVLIK